MSKLVSCHLCGAAGVECVPDYETLCRVTSDCRPWPSGGHLGACRACGAVQNPVDGAWQAEVQQIYDAYSIYHQAEGSEQSVFEPATGAAASRSSHLLKCLRARVQLPATGRLLDVGCGNGAFLRAVSTALPSWSLVGTEIGDKYRAIVEGIHGVEALYTCPPEKVPGTFDLITMVHVLEHIPGPKDILGRLRDKLNPDGLLLIEVPNYTRNPFDLLIADHCSHFSAATLSSLVQDAGFDLVAISADWVAKELSVVARRSRQAKVDIVPSTELLKSVADSLQWLKAVVAEAHSFAETDSFGLFGTSIAATWLAGELREKVTFFVDEDTSRVGRNYMGRPVYHPNSVPARSAVFLALPPQVSESVKGRLMQYARNYELCTPPPFPGMAD
jgi:SAM-dependent methyltransferase